MKNNVNCNRVTRNDACLPQGRAVRTFSGLALLLALCGAAQQAGAAIALDRTRVIFNGSENSVSLSATNENKELPFLAQAWIENERGEKITSPFTALPPLQRVEPGAKTQVKVQQTGGATALPQDRESLFYFNLREIPPKPTKPNTLQLALQTRVKMFYRPKAIALSQADQADPWQKKLTLSREGERFAVINPAPYYATIVGASATKKGASVAGFAPVMVPPRGRVVLSGSAASLGSNPVLTYIDDYGGRPELTFSCSGSTCAVSGQSGG